MIHKQHERILVGLVRTSEIEIDQYGNIWRIGGRYGAFQNGTRAVIPVKRRRMDRLLPNGYRITASRIKGIQYVVPSHRLVWQYFNGDIPQGMVINHLNGHPADNRPLNLEITTYGGNLSHAFRNGFKSQDGEKNPASKLTNRTVEVIRFLYSRGKYNQDELAAIYEVSRTAITNLIRGESYSVAGGKLSLSNRKKPNPRNATSVVAIDSGGNAVKDFDSMHAAAKWSGAMYNNISKCCLGERNKAGGYGWRYRGDQFRIKNRLPVTIFKALKLGEQEIWC